MTMPQSPDKDDFAAEPRSIDLRDYWLVVRRRWLLILVLTALGAAVGGGYARSLAPTYSATAQVLVSGITGGPGVPASQVNAPVNMSTEQSVAQGTGVIDAAAQILKVQQSVLQAKAAKDLTVTVPATTLTTSNVLQITWKAASPQAAQAGADAFATAFLAGWHKGLVAQVASLQASLSLNVASLAKQIEHVSAQLSDTLPTSSAHTSLEISLNELTGLQSTASSELEQINTYNTSGGSVIPAAPPAAPSGISHSVIIVVGALIGLILGLVLAFLWNTFDDRVREPAQLEHALGAPVLAVLPLAKNRSGEGKAGSQRRQQAVATVASPSSQSAEAVRVLRAALVTAAARRNLSTVLVVAADPAVATGRVVGELGVALAESGRRVLLIAADMRNSVLPQLFDLSNQAGLSDLLTSGGDPEMLINQPEQAGGVTLPSDVAQRLRVLPPGGEIAHALSVIDSDTMISLLQSQRDTHEFVVLDSPPVNIAADAIALAGHVDGVIVIASHRVKGRAINDLRRRLDQVDARLIGGAFIIKAKAGRRRQLREQPRLAASSPDAEQLHLAASSPDAEQLHLAASSPDTEQPHLAASNPHADDTMPLKVERRPPAARRP